MDVEVMVEVAVDVIVEVFVLEVVAVVAELETVLVNVEVTVELTVLEAVAVELETVALVVAVTVELVVLEVVAVGVVVVTVVVVVVLKHTICSSMLYLPPSPSVLRAHTLSPCLSTTKASFSGSSLARMPLFPAFSGQSRAAASAQAPVDVSQPSSHRPIWTTTTGLCTSVEHTTWRSSAHPIVPLARVAQTWSEPPWKTWKESACSLPRIRCHWFPESSWQWAPGAVTHFGPNMSSWLPMLTKVK